MMLQKLRKFLIRVSFSVWNVSEILANFGYCLSNKTEKLKLPSNRAQCQQLRKILFSDIVRSQSAIEVNDFIFIPFAWFFRSQQISYHYAVLFCVNF